MPTQESAMKVWRQTAFVIAFVLGGIGAAWSQAYPARAVRIVVPFAAGSATDIMARILADEFRLAFNESFVVDNRPGASAQIGAEIVARAPADGYTLLVTTNTSHSANPFLFKKIPYDPVKDFAPVAGLMRIPVILVVDPKIPVNSLQELIDYAKARPGKLSFGYGNSIGQVVGASFARRMGLDVVSVPYKSSPQAMTDVISGQVTYTVADMASGQGHVKTGKLKALAISSAKRSPLMPEVPAMAETPGLEGFEVIAWVALFAPAGTPRPIVQQLNVLATKTLTKPEVREKIIGFAAEVAGSSPDELGEFVKAQLGSWEKSIREAGIQPE
jgi:tripartite-type tricarboxylate transporter receptor subunit TctC